MSEIKVNKISPLTPTGTVTLGGKGLVIGGTGENTTLIIATTQNPIAPPSDDMGIWITDGTVQSTYGYQATAPNLVGDYLGTYSNHPVGIITNNSTKLLITPTGNVGIGTTTPGLKFDVAGGIRASLKVITEEAFALAPAQLYTTQRTFTQVINTAGSNAANPVTANQAIAGQTWLLGTFSDVNAAPAMFKFVHNTHSGSNIQSDSYEWSRTYVADAPASATDPTAWSNWVELPVTTSVVYASARQFRFDVRAQYGSGGMQLRLRASTPTSAYDGPHYFTFTTTGMANYTPETVFSVATAPTTLPTGFHGRQAYEFPVSKGNYGFAGSTAGVFILNNGNVGIGTVAPAVTLDVVGDIRATANLTVASVGIGASSPLAPLHVKGTAAEQLRLDSSNSNVSLGFYSGSSYKGQILSSSDSTLYLTSAGNTVLQTGSSSTMAIINATQRVGIGNTNPQVTLDVTGEVRSSTSTTTASNPKTLATKDYVDDPVRIGSVFSFILPSGGYATTAVTTAMNSGYVMPPGWIVTSPYTNSANITWTVPANSGAWVGWWTAMNNTNTHGNINWANSGSTQTITVPASVYNNTPFFMTVRRVS